MSIHFRGAGGAPGSVLGRAAVCRPAAFAAPTVPGEDASAALARFAAAQRHAAEQLLALAEQFRAEGHAAQAGIFEAQSLLVEDAVLTDEVARLVHAGTPLAQALDSATTGMRRTLEALDDAYLRERAADVDAAGAEVQRALGGAARLDVAALPPDAIIVAPDLTPSETAGLRGTARGFATAYGGPTGHTAILARSLGIPAAVGLGAALLGIAEGTPLALHGSAALLIADPTPDECAAVVAQAAAQRVAHVRHAALRAQPGQLRSGERVALWANIGHPDEAQTALAHGAEGIGLFRTEFLFFERAVPPDEDEQVAAYRAVLEPMVGRPVVVRTLDVGGDKPLPYLPAQHEANPFLGMRGLRLCMQHTPLFATQLRALLRAAAYGDLRIMFPMIATPDDLAWGRAQLQAAAQALQAAGVPHRADLPLGIMIETPAAAVTADLFAPAAAFFSIGSNDLAQYALAADRGHPELAARYPHGSPAVFRLIAQAAAAATHAGIPVGICGELGSVPAAALALVGLGLAEVSMTPAAIPLVKEHLRAATMADAKHAAAARMGLRQQVA